MQAGLPALPPSMYLCAVLGFFRQNNAFAAAMLFVYVLLLRAPSLLGLVQVDGAFWQGGGVLYQLLPEAIRMPGFLSAAASALLVWLQSIIISLTLDRARLMPQRGWIPGAIYALLASSSADLQLLSAAQVAVTLTPFLVYQAMSMYNKKDGGARMFNLGFILAVGSLVYPSFFWFFLAFLPISTIWTSPPLRDWFKMILAIVVVYFLSFTGSFWMDEGARFVDTQTDGWRSGFGLPLPSNRSEWAGVGVLWCVLALILLQFPLFYQRRLIQEQKFASTLFWWLLVALLTFFTAPVWPEVHWHLALYPMAVLLSMRLQHWGKGFWPELVHFLLVMLIVFALFVDFFIHLFV